MSDYYDVMLFAIIVIPFAYGVGRLHGWSAGWEEHKDMIKWKDKYLPDVIKAAEKEGA